MNPRKKLQDSINESGYDYKLKTNMQLINTITDFGFGETEFHTADIERLIKEHQLLLSTLKRALEYVERNKGSLAPFPTRSELDEYNSVIDCVSF